MEGQLELSWKPSRCIRRWQ